MVQTKVTGIVVCGGNSSRMGTDKSMLVYHEGKPQRYYLYDLLSSVCENVLISCNKSQSNTIPDTYSVIEDSDKYHNIGPMASLLSAFEKYPGHNFLLIGCDYPFIGKKEIELLLRSFCENNSLVSLVNSDTQIEEPLLAVYPSDVYPVLTEQFSKKEFSLRHLLKKLNSIRIPASGPVVKSVDTPETYKEALLILASGENK